MPRPAPTFKVLFTFQYCKARSQHSAFESWLHGLSALASAGDNGRQPRDFLNHVLLFWLEASCAWECCPQTRVSKRPPCQAAHFCAPQADVRSSSAGKRALQVRLCQAGDNAADACVYAGKCLRTSSWLGRLPRRRFTKLRPGPRPRGPWQMRSPRQLPGRWLWPKRRQPTKRKANLWAWCAMRSGRPSMAAWLQRRCFWRPNWR